MKEKIKKRLSFCNGCFTPSQSACRSKSRIQAAKSKGKKNVDKERNLAAHLLLFHRRAKAPDY